jgi:hypothetical protein
MAYQANPQKFVLNQYSGMGVNDGNFIQFIKRFNDLYDAMGRIPNLDDKIKQLKCYLTDYARERFDELTQQDKANWATVETRLQAMLEDPQLTSVARARLSAIKQKPNESVLVFSQRLKSAVKASCAGETPATYQSQLLNAFMDKLNRKIGFYVKTTRPANFLSALNQALHYESLCEAEADSEAIPASYQVNSNIIDDNTAEIKELKDKVSQLEDMLSRLLRQNNEPRQGPSQRYEDHDRSYDTNHGRKLVL